MSKLLENAYKYKTPEICRALGVSRMTLWIWEQQGKVSFPRNGHGDRVVTEKQLREIKEAFSPGGKYYWKFE